jgi:hypothetical protein
MTSARASRAFVGVMLAAAAVTASAEPVPFIVINDGGGESGQHQACTVARDWHDRGENKLKHAHDDCGDINFADTKLTFISLAGCVIGGGNSNRSSRPNS